VIVPHSSFKKIGLPPDMLQEILTEQVNDLIESIESLKRKNGEPVLIKRMEKAHERLEELIERKAQTGEKTRP
jgi:CO dehydrogenase/acetyl-CoA synthase beta subunit